MTLSIMTFCIMALRITILNKTPSMKDTQNNVLSIMIHRIMILRIMALSILTLSLMTLSIITSSINDI